MHRTYFQPHPALKEYVEDICLAYHNFSDDSTISPFYTYAPSHTRFLCFHLHDTLKVKKQTGAFENRARALLIGPHNMPVHLDLGNRHKSIVIVLKPCGMYRLLGMPLTEMLNVDCDAGLLLGPQIDELVDRLMTEKKDDEKINIVQHYLLKKLNHLKPALPFDEAITALVNSHGNLSIEQIAAQSCLSLRQFERKCLERVGFSPKFFSRMIRFSKAYRFKECFPEKSWTEIAYRFGYYDQMHLIREFKKFYGFAPGCLDEDLIAHSIKFNSLER